MAKTPDSSTISLKLLIDSKREKVLFAEAGKDFVDVLFSLLSLPVSTITTLLGKDGMVGSVGQLYKSVENLSDTYLQPDIDMDILLKPKAPFAAGSPNVLGLLESPAQNKVLYMCSPNCSNTFTPPSPFSFDRSILSDGNTFTPLSPPLGLNRSIPSNDSSTTSHRYVTEDPSDRCPSCKCLMSAKATYVRPTSSGGSGGEGYVKGVVTYMVMDDLEVKPMSTISSITLLNRFNVKDLSALEEKVVHFGIDEGVKLLKELLCSNSVLTNVFLLGKKTTARSSYSSST